MLVVVVVVVVVAAVVICSACDRAERPPDSSDSAVTRPDVYAPGADTANRNPNPFTRTSFEDATEPCTTMTLIFAQASRQISATIENKCDRAVAVLTSPMELRVRHSGSEQFVHERMSWTAYAIMYVVFAELKGDAFRGDGVIRDGGLRVRRPPSYTTVPANATVSVPVRCNIDAPAGRYAIAVMTYEAMQGDAHARSDRFNCEESVKQYNTGAEGDSAVYLGGDVREVQSGTITVQLG
jgi:hypothetical protein